MNNLPPLDNLSISVGLIIGVCLAGTIALVVNEWSTGKMERTTSRQYREYCERINKQWR